MLLMVVFQLFNLDIDGGIEPTIINDADNSIFGAMTSHEVILQRLVKNGLFLLCHRLVKLKDIVLFLIGGRPIKPNFPRYLLTFDLFSKVLGPKSKLG
jgi:hypothetical protein